MIMWVVLGNAKSSTDAKNDIGVFFGIVLNLFMDKLLAV